MRSKTKLIVTLKLDHDPHARRLSLRELVKRAERANVTLIALGERRSPSGRGWHRWLVVSPAPASACEMVALQLLFGSDPYREAYLINRARAIDAKKVRGYWSQLDNFNVLYTAVRVRSDTSHGAARDIINTVTLARKEKSPWQRSRVTRCFPRCGRKTSRGKRR
jgi:hypothetical protein